MAKWWPTLPRKSSSFVVETTTFGHLVCLPMFNAKFASHFIFIVFDPWPFLHPLILEIKLLPFRLGSLGCCVVIIFSGCCTTVRLTNNRRKCLNVAVDLVKRARALFIRVTLVDIWSFFFLFLNAKSKSVHFLFILTDGRVCSVEAITHNTGGRWTAGKTVCALIGW